MAHARDTAKDPTLFSDQAWAEEAADIGRDFRQIAAQFRELDAPVAARAMHPTVLELADVLDTIGLNYSGAFGADGDLYLMLEAESAMERLATPLAQVQACP